MKLSVVATTCPQNTVWQQQPHSSNAVGNRFFFLILILYLDLRIYGRYFFKLVPKTN